MERYDWRVHLRQEEAPMDIPTVEEKIKDSVWQKIFTIIKSFFVKK